MDLSDNDVSRRRDSLDELVKPKCSLQVAPFNTLTLNQIGKQAALRRIIEAPKINVRCLRLVI